MNADEYIAYHQLKPGDTIVSCFKEKKAGIKGLFHYVVFLGEDSAIHNVPDTGVTLVSMEEIALDYSDVYRIERFKGGESGLDLLYARANEKLGMPYDTLQFNCESLANYLRYGVSVSKQVQEILTKIILYVLAFIAIYHLIRGILQWSSGSGGIGGGRRGSSSGAYI